jgi:asparagine synthase (glutamine-hydrolysing)
VGLKLAGGEGKAIFKEALLPRLPEGIMYRRKQGFSIPVHRWFREEWRQWAREILLDPSTLRRKLFREDSLERMLREHQSGAINHGQRIWALITLELWFRQFVDRRPAPASAAA